MSEQYLITLGDGDFDAGLDKAVAALDQAGYRFLPGGGHRAPDGRLNYTYRTLPFWMQIALVHRTWAGFRRLRQEVSGHLEVLA